MVGRLVLTFLRLLTEESLKQIAFRPELGPVRYDEISLGGKI